MFYVTSEMNHIPNPIITIICIEFGRLLTEAEIVSSRNRHLQRLVNHAYHHVAYYRRLFDQHGLIPSDIRTVEDLYRIPVTTRRELKDVPEEDRVARGVILESLICHKTSRSSGTPFTVRRTWMEERIGGCFRRRALRSFGLHRTDRHHVVIAGRPPDPADRQLVLGLIQKMGVFFFLEWATFIV